MNYPIAIQHNVPLAPEITLGVGGAAKLFVEVTNVTELQSAIQYAKAKGESWVILGGGSNVFISDEGYDGLVIKMVIRGITLVKESKSGVVVSVGAGINFDDFVAYTVERGWWGLENLSSIPGTVGATPVQNVGAYGVEISHTVLSVEVYDTTTNTMVVLTREECGFGYRTSVFKAKPERYIITSVTFVLSLQPRPQLTYADLIQYFVDKPAPILGDIRQAVQLIRAQKFPNWNITGTAGSFFKNPIVPKKVAEVLLEKYPELPSYSEEGDMVKLSLGYILDKICGLKGYKQGKVRLYEKQALVLVAERGAKASEIILFAEDIKQKVFLETGIKIEYEVTCL
jgi:UDP-N-acetylmuramate dehydrogenase